MQNKKDLIGHLNNIKETHKDNHMNLGQWSKKYGWTSGQALGDMTNIQKLCTIGQYLRYFDIEVEFELTLLTYKVFSCKDVRSKFLGVRLLAVQSNTQSRS